MLCAMTFLLRISENPHIGWLLLMLMLIFCVPFFLPSFSIAFIHNMSFNSPDHKFSICKQAFYRKKPTKRWPQHSCIGTHKKCQTAVCCACLFFHPVLIMCACVCVSLYVSFLWLYEWIWVIAINWTACSLYNRRVIPFYLLFLSRFWFLSVLWN